jgi:hypothetical protein
VVFLQPVSLKSDRTKKADKTLKGLAQDFGMTDIKSTKEGEHQTGYIKRNNKQTEKQRQLELEAAESREPKPRDSAIWGGAGGMSLQSVMGGQFRPVKDEQVSVLPKSVGDLTGPRAASYIADHENLTIKK